MNNSMIRPDKSGFISVGKMQFLRAICLTVRAVLVGVILGGAATPAAAQSTRFEPAPDDPRIIAVIANRDRLNAALRTGDASVVDGLLASDFVVNAPIGQVVDRANLLGRIRTGEVRQEETVLNLKFAGVRGNLVVLMGEEIVRPAALMPNAGSTVRRRFTDVWREDGGTWKLAIRQATIVAVD
ncbi:nuclear transport factor 2 family protein [Oleiharenicola lentus]|nr:nuclear transport factor 2 family protein [Oleiharenicola lentus]